MNKQQNFLEFFPNKTKQSELIHSQFIFRLDATILARLQQQKHLDLPLEINSEIFSRCRYYTIKQLNQCVLAGINFLTVYQQEQREIPIINSILFTDYRIIHHLQQNSLENIDNILEIIAVHNWLIEQVLNKLSEFKSKRVDLNYCSALSTALIVLIYVIFFHQTIIKQITILKILAFVIAISLLFWGVKKLIAFSLPYCRRWLFQQTIVSGKNQPACLNEFLFKLAERLY